jgi:hypothetical protein
MYPTVQCSAVFLGEMEGSGAELISAMEFQRVQI